MADPQNPPATTGAGNPPVVTPPATPPAAVPPQHWYESHESLKPHATVMGKFKDPGALGLAYVNLEKGLGNRIPIPGADATPEQLAEFRTKLGVPADAKGYGEYKAPEGLPWDKGLEDRFYTDAHKLGLTPTQVKGLMDFQARESQNSLARVSADFKTEQDAAVKVLRDTWGAGYDRNVALAQQAVATYGDKQFAQMLDETGLGNHPAMLKFLAKYGEGLVEDGIIKPELVGQTTEAAQAEIAKLMQEKPFMDRNHPDHDRLIERISDLYKHAYPGV